MKALIVSDSHGLTQELNIIKERHRSDADIMIHCGDSELHPKSGELEGFVTVKGNMDYSSEFPAEAIEPLGDAAMYITHGHLYNVKMGHLALAYRAEETGAKIVCFGHSHVAEAFERSGTVFINPGSIRMPRGRKEKTYALCEIQDGQMVVEFYTLDGERLEEMKKRFSIA
ncbi:metallophosphoesterase family protein [Fictibacillus aquaticus]|uniref:Phosphoesterase n=1 Tax=Fictibacillus aquaticus TaxID=2021314 RepID=A0A235FAI9_9BACL|nr:metallophosphoesterase [Fictibacillus aquaticus]OYD58318.1 YfcE family phosphodiesterase [Fictibacillus aquaticus]